MEKRNRDMGHRERLDFAPGAVILRVGKLLKNATKIGC
jgi:hypothetical protein